MHHVQGFKGEAVVVYCESLITKKMECSRLSIKQGITSLADTASDHEHIRTKL
jgi:hypothetical protein